MIYFTPGPSQLYPTVPKHIQNAVQDGICSVSHRSQKFEEIFAGTIRSLKNLLKIPADWQVFFLGSATEAMERVIQNCTARHSFHLVNGAFSQRFFEMAQELRKQPQKYEVEFGQGFNFEEIEVSKEAELIGVTQNETSSGVAVKPADIYQLKRQYPDKLIVVDVVSSAPGVNLDFSRFDAVFFSVQKAFGLPAGLGVLIVNQSCLAKSRQLEHKDYNIGSFHSFPSLLQKAQKHQTPETPNVLGIYLLGKVCDNMMETGIDKIREEIDEKAQLIYNFLDSGEFYQPFVKDKRIRSKTVIVAKTPGSSAPFIKKLAECGFVVGAGYSQFKDQQIRLANFPAHSVEEVEKLIKNLC